MRAVLLLLWLLTGRWLISADAGRTPKPTRVAAPERRDRAHVSVLLAHVAGSLGVIGILFGPSIVSVSRTAGSETFYSAAAQALPALLIAVALAYRAMLGEVRIAFAPIWSWRGPLLAAQVHLCVWAMLVGSGACFTALTSCAGGRCGSPEQLDRVYLGLGASYWLVAQFVIAAFLARMTEFERDCR